MFDTILVGVDRSDTAAEAARQADRLAARLGSHLHVVSVYPDPSDVATGSPLAAETEAYLSDLTAGYEAETTVHALPGSPADALLEVADEIGADLVVLGNRGMHGPARLLGSVPNTVSHKAKCSVLIVRTT